MCLSIEGKPIHDALTSSKRETCAQYAPTLSASRITDSEKAAEAGRLSEMRFRQFFEALPESCYMVSRDGTILDVNPAACKAFGYEREELVAACVLHLRT
jgi:PAS domain-containing protein